MFYNEKNRLIAVLPANGPSKSPLKGDFPANQLSASPPALPRREGAGALNRESDKELEEKLVIESAPSLRGRAGGEAEGLLAEAFIPEHK